MHRLRHAHTIRSLRITALLLCSKRLALASAVILLVAYFVTGDRRLSVSGLALAASVVPLTLLQWIAAGAARCPLCMMPVLSRSGCARHRFARSIFGSQRLRVALSILLLGRFRCPYCNEPTLLRLKGRP